MIVLYVKSGLLHKYWYTLLKTNSKINRTLVFVHRQHEHIILINRSVVAAVRIGK